MKLGVFLATFGAAAMGQSLNTFTCSPTSIAVGASFNCVVSITSVAPLAGVPIHISTAAAGLTFPATVTVSWGRTSSSFPVTTTTSTPPQVVAMVAAAGLVSKSAPVSLTSTASYTVTSLRCTPSKLIPAEIASCVAYLSAEAPAGGLIATLTSSSANLSIPASVSIPATLTGFQFQAKASSAATIVENVTVTALVKASSLATKVTIDPTPKFYLRGNNTELSLLTNGAAVAPSVHPAGWLGALTVRGAGYFAFNPIWGTSGFSFHANGGQNTNTAFLNFSGTNFATIFENSSEISFRLKSNYSFAERKALPSLNMRGAFEVWDDAGPWYNFSTYTSSTGALQFSYGARGYSAIYVVPAGYEDRIFGKGVTAKIRINWTNTSFSLYVNDVLVSTATMPPKVANWSSRSALTIGSRSIRTGGGGYYASDDAISEFIIR